MPILRPACGTDPVPLHPSRTASRAGGVRRRELMFAAAAGAGMSWSHAQAWPSRPIRIVVPFPPGSAADAIPRRIAQHLQVALDTACVVDNRPGAAGSIGATEVAAAAPDGHTLLSHSSTIAIQPHLVPAGFDLLRDLVAVGQTVAGSYVLLVHPAFPAATLQELLDEVRRAPGRYSYASHGSGSGPHLAMELLKGEAGLFILHVPFRGAAPALQEVLAGRVDMAFDTTFAALPHVRAGRLRAIAVGGPRPVDALPGTLPVASLVPGFDTDGWQGLFAPAGTPDAIVRRLSEEAAAALRDAELASMIVDLGFRPVGSGPEQFAELVRADHERWGRVVRARGIKPD
jgi:tripartite-type tricarboxylate transporter receptor subunit TctC